MNPSRKWSLALLALLAGALTTGSAFAWGHRSHVTLGFHFGFPAYYPAPYYYSPYYYPAPSYYPSPVIVQQPPVYTERQEVAPEAQNYWYYCAATRGYYPYVKECPGGWQKVPPAPPPG